MRIFSIELKITLLILVIVASIIATGYLSYKNLSQIVQSIHREARPDYKLIKIKEINSDLLEVDHSVRLYSLTGEPKYLRPYDQIISTVDKSINELLSLQGDDTTQLSKIRDIQELIGERLVVWDQILTLHSKPIEKEVFEEFYNTIEKKTTDSQPEKKDNILKRFFKKKKEITLGKEEVQQEVAKLERSLSDVAIKQAEKESRLLNKNNELGAKLQFQILQLEQAETESLFIKSLEAEILAVQTYRWLAVFCIAAVALLIVVLFIIINYSRKASQSQRILRQAKIEADKLVKAKELFTANVSHELRTPMNAIYGLSEQLLQQPMDDKLKEQLSVIKKSADYMNKVVNDILDFSKIQAGKLSIESIPFNPQKILKEICSLNQIMADQKKLDFNCSFSDSIPEQIVGDPVRLRQIILNLLSNAFKFTNHGHVSMIVNASFPDDKSVLLSIVVSDTGIGISPEKLNTIFEDYTQAEDSINRRYGGTGLGLSIVKKLIDMMHGTIEVTSVQHQGTSFTCNIPFTVSKESELLQDDQEILQVPESIKNISVLVADDEEYNRMLLTTIFKKWNIKFRAVTNGVDAVQLASGNRFDIVMMDLRMPVMNGYDATREILSASPKTKVIALTAGNFSDDIKQCKECGMAGFLLKPFSERELIESIQEVLGEEAPVVNDTPYTLTIGTSDEIQLEALYRASGGDEHFVDEMLGLFLKTTHDGTQKLTQYLQERNWSGISETAHKMAPPCRHLGANALYKNLKELEKLGNDTKDYLIAKQLVETVNDQVSVITSKIGQKTAWS